MELPGTAPTSSPTMAFLGSEFVFSASRYTYPNSIMTVTTNQTLYSYNMPSGTLQWQLDLGGPVSGSLISERYNTLELREEENRDVTGYIGTLNGKFYAIDMRTGTIKWTYETESGLGFAGNAMVFENFIRKYLIVGAEDGFVYAFETETGALEWRYDIGASVQGQPIVISIVQIPYVATVNSIGVVTVHNLNNGTQIMSTQLPTAIQASLYSYKLQNNVNSTLVIGGLNGVVYALNARNGQIEWQYDAGSPIYSSIIANLSFRATNPRPPYEYETLGNLYVATEESKVLALSESGGLVWELDLNEGPIYSSPTITETRDRDFNRGEAIHIQTPRGIVGIEPSSGEIYSKYIASNGGIESGNSLSSPYGVKVDRQTRGRPTVTIEPSESSIVNSGN